MDVVTPATLIRRLKEVYGVTTDDALAWELKTSARQIARWKAGGGPGFWTTVDLLNRAGWFTPTADLPTPERVRAAERYAAEMQAAAKRFADSPPSARETDAK